MNISISSDNNYSFTNFNPDSSTGVGQTDYINKVFNEYFDKTSLLEDLYLFCQELQAVLDETSSVNWDGYGADIFDKDSLIEAMRFIDMLPTSIPLPEVSTDPDGEISFDWYNKSAWVFSISFSSSKELIYAGIFGQNKIHGVEYFSDDIPKQLINNLIRVYSN